MKGRPAFNPDKLDFSQIANEKRGHIAAIAQHYSVNEATIYTLQLRDPEIKSILAEARKIHHERELDLAVSLNYKFMADYEKNPGLASLHTRYTLDKRGFARGYLKEAPSNDVDDTTEISQSLQALIKDQPIVSNNVAEAS
jgi:hypothetical protein